jgi:hypothetical protein
MNHDLTHLLSDVEVPLRRAVRLREAEGDSLRWFVDLLAGLDDEEREQLLALLSAAIRRRAGAVGREG